MLARRSIVLLLLLTVPVVIYVVLGAYALWRADLLIWTWLVPVCWVMAWMVAKIWKPKRKPWAIGRHEFPHRTPNDEAAKRIVEAYKQRVQGFSAQQLMDPHFYLSQVQELAQELAQLYHPKGKDPISQLTIGELLTAVTLAVDDLEKWYFRIGLGAEFLTVGHWKKLRHLPQTLQHLSRFIWGVSMVASPVATAGKYALSQLTRRPLEQVGDDLQAGLYATFIERCGYYLIEMYSGRLRGGVKVYRETFEGRPFAEDLADLQVTSLTVAIVGQVKAGKSSLVNALLGEQKAGSDILPLTAEVERFEFQIPETNVQLTLLDTPGYADSGATKKQTQEIHEAVQQADLILLVMHAQSPARKADQDVLQELQDWQRKHDRLKPVPVIACLTHIDLLSPMMEWSPPYDWREPKTPKENSIHDAVAYHQELFGPRVRHVIPLSTDVARNRAAHVDEELLPAMVDVIDDAHSAALLRAFSNRLSQERWQRLKGQLFELGRFTLTTWLDQRLTRLRPRP